ncbi:hypothetical protein PIROE2DRAFT_27061, partial [Piromyces sp. E2]
ETGWNLLHYASHNGNLKLINILLECGFNEVNIKCNDGSTPLMLSVKNGKFDCASRLMECSIDVNIFDNIGDTPLTYMIKHNDVFNEYIFDSLILKENKANIKKQDNQGETPISFVLKHSSEQLKFLLQVNPNIDLNEKNENKNTALMISLKNKHFDIVREILKYKYINVNISNKQGYNPLFYMIKKSYQEEDIFKSIMSKYKNINEIDCKKKTTPLIYAIQKKKEFFVKLLLENKKVDIDTRDSENKTPLDYAVETKKSKLIKLLIYRNYDKKSEFTDDIQEIETSGLTPLLLAINNNDILLVKYLIDHQVELKRPNRNEVTPFRKALDKSNIKILRLLLAKDKKIPIEDNNLQPLIFAIKKNNPEFVKLLIENGADINEFSYNGNTPLLQAINNDNTEIIHLLIDNGVNLNQCNNEGKLPLEIAKEKNNEKEAINLIQNGANVNYEHKNGLTPLLYAIHKNNLKMIDLLISYGAKVDLINKNGMTPVNFALSQGNIAIITTIVSQKYGADINAIDNNGETALFHAAQYNNYENVESLVKCGAIIDIINNRGK